MALRTAAAAYWKSTAYNGRLRGGSWTFSTSSTSPKLRLYADHSLSSPQGIKTKWRKQAGDFIPVYGAVGFIALSVSFGLVTVFHQMARSPNVTLKKSRREMIPEVVEPERVAEYGERFLKQSFFRKIAHIQYDDGFERRGSDVFTRPVRLESLKDVGVEVKPPHY